MTIRQIAYNIAGLFFISLILVLGINGKVNAQAVPIDEIVAVVNDDIIVHSELKYELQKIVTLLRQQGRPLPAQEVLVRQILGRLILKKLQLAAAARVGINVGEDVLAQAINNIAQNNNLSLGEFRRTLQESGVDFRRFRENLREQITIQKLLDQEVRGRTRITDQEVAAFLARQSASQSKRSEYRLQHILVATPEAASPEQLQQARSKADSLVKALRDGADFHRTALSESDGRQALEGGDLGWRPATQLPTIFVDIVTDMERDQISEPIRTSSGYHIIKLADYKGGVRKIINQTHVRQILINTNEVTSNNDAQNRLEQLRQRIVDGDDFATLARSHSDDKSSAIKGGDLGWITQGDTLPEFEQQMGKLTIGEISQPFRTDFGWHIIQTLGQREHDSTSEVQKAEAREAISKRKVAEEGELYLRRLKDEAYIDIRLGK